MDFTLALQSMAKLQAQFGGMLDVGVLVFARVLAFIYTAPVFDRKDIPFMIKLAKALFLTLMLIWLLPPGTRELVKKSMAPGLFVVLIMVNIVVGSLIGLVATMVFKTISSAGSMMNNQIGLSSAMVMDPSTRQQTMVLEPLFNMIATLLFIHLGGIEWLTLALQRSFVVMPLTTVFQPIREVIPMDYWIHVSSNAIMMATILVAPVMIVTMAVDVMLGIVNRAAQQMPVFQLSFALKPCIGIVVMLITLPVFLQLIGNFLNDYSPIY